MGSYFNYLGDAVQLTGANIGKLFSGQLNLEAESVKYRDLYNAYSLEFTTGDWIMFILFILLFAALVTSLVLLIIYLIKKLIGNRRTKNEGKMLEEIERLNLELYDTMREKDRIIGLARAGEGGAIPDGGGVISRNVDAKVEVKGGPRFSRLTNVDEKYKEGDYVAVLPEDANQITLKEICERFRNFACSQMRLFYTPETVRQFFAAMGTGKLIILEGISGTGKTSLPYCMGRFFQHNASICSVQPSWRDRSELLGYYNDFTKKFTETEFLRSVYEATFRNDCSLIVLDEMNLARIEYYFAEFLSIMEMPNVAEWIVDVIASSREDDPKHLEGGKLLIPQNIWFIGTANNDDSTFTITDKVYDRAISLFFDNKGQAFDAPYTEALPLPADYLLDLYDQAKKNYPISEDTLEKFAQLDDFVIEHFKLAFGNRIMKQLHSFVPCYVAAGGTELEAFDFIFKTKILKKFEVLNVAFLRDELTGLDAELTKLFGKDEFPLSRDKIRLLIKMSR